MRLREAPIAAADLDPVPVAGCAPRCARCAIRRAGPASHTVCKLCHSGCGPDFRGMRPTVCKLCNSARRARPPYGVQCVPFRVRPGLPQDAPDGEQGVQFGAPDPAPLRCATCAIPGAARTSAGCARRCARCAIRRAGPASHTVCNLCHSGCGPDFRRMRPTVCKVCNSARRTCPPYGVQCVPFRVWPGLPRDAPDGVQGVPFGAPRPPLIRCARCAIPSAARTAAGCARRCASRAIRRAGPRLATGHRRPATVCKVCKSPRREIGGRGGRDDP